MSERKAERIVSPLLFDWEENLAIYLTKGGFVSITRDRLIIYRGGLGKRDKHEIDYLMLPAILEVNSKEGASVTVKTSQDKYSFELDSEAAEKSFTRNLMLMVNRFND